MKKQIAIIVGLLLCGMAYSSDIERVSVTYEYLSNDPNETPAQAEKTALEKARQKALEDKFGLDATSQTNTFISNSNGQSEVNVLALGGTSIRGEWIETTKEQVIEKKFVNGFWVIKVHVEGRARHTSTEKTDIRFAFVRDVRETEPPVTFRDGDDLFLRFYSPVAGYLCVYLVDEEQNAFCLLPYISRQTGSHPIEANKDYIFFSPLYDQEAQEYTLNCRRSSEQNILLVIFSPNEFTKAADKQGGKNYRDEQLPRELSYEALLKWLSRNQSKDPKMLVHRSIITIRP